MRETLKMGILILAVSIACLSRGGHMGHASSDFSVRVRFLSFVPDRWVEIDYILAVELEIPSVSYYDEKRTDCSRYLSQIPPLEFPCEDSWTGLNARLTVFARWHAIDAIIDINPNPQDGRWTPQGKQASALVVWFIIGSDPMQGSADGNDDGYLSDLRNDAFIKYVVETLKDGEVIPEFPTWIAWFTAIGASALTVGLGIKKVKRYPTKLTLTKTNIAGHCSKVFKYFVNAHLPWLFTPREKNEGMR